jgi:hypothetical protein
MRFHTSTSLLRALSPLFIVSAGAAGCGTETVEPDVFFLSESNATLATGETWLEVVFQPRTPLPDGTLYAVRIDGKRVLMSPEDPTPWAVNPGCHAGKRADNLAGGAHVVELLAPKGQVALTTSLIKLTPGRGNQIVVYGDASDLHYYFFDNPAEVSDAVPAGSILARVLNIRTDGQSVDILSCPLAPTSTSDCTAATSGLAYGQIWEQVFTRDRALTITGDVAGTAGLWGVSFSSKCSTNTGTMVEPKVETVVLSQANGYFDLYDLAGLQTCMRP